MPPDNNSQYEVCLPYLQLPAENPLQGVFEVLGELLGEACFLAPSLSEAGGVYRYIHMNIYIYLYIYI